MCGTADVSTSFIVREAFRHAKEDPVGGVAWSPLLADGSRLAIGLWDGKVRIWHQHTQQVMHTLHVNMVMHITCVAWSPCGKMLAASYFNGTVTVWSVTGTEYNLLHRLCEHRYVIKGMAWSACGTRLATASRIDNTVCVWRLDGTSDPNESVSKFEAHPNDVFEVSWSPCGVYLATCSEDATCRVWRQNLTDNLWQTVYVLQKHTEAVRSVAWFPVSLPEFAKNILATGSRDGTVRIWRFDPSSDTAEHLLVLHNFYALSVAWSPRVVNGCMQLAAGTDFHTAHVWRIDPRDNTSQMLWTLCGYAHRVNSVAWSPCGAMLATGSYDGSVHVWDLRKWTPLTNARFHPKARQVVVRVMCARERLLRAATLHSVQVMPLEVWLHVIEVLMSLG